MSRPPGTPAVHLTAPWTREAEPPPTPRLEAAAESGESASRRRRRAYRWIDRLRAADPELAAATAPAGPSATADAPPGPLPSSRRPAVIRVRELRRDFEYHYEYVYAEDDS